MNTSTKIEQSAIEGMELEAPEALRMIARINAAAVKLVSGPRTNRDTGRYMKQLKIRITIDMFDDGSITLCKSDDDDVSPTAVQHLMLGMLSAAQYSILSKFKFTQGPLEGS